MVWIDWVIMNNGRFFCTFLLHVPLGSLVLIDYFDGFDLRGCLRVEASCFVSQICLEYSDEHFGVVLSGRDDCELVANASDTSVFDFRRT